MNKISTHAAAAKAIRAELKENFPSIKFSVRSESYAGGNNVCISWINGPTEEEVEKIVNKYEYGSFNGMTDSYEYDNVKKDIPQVFYVFCEREEKKNRIEKRLESIR